jgi:hypothetical protein
MPQPIDNNTKYTGFSIQHRLRTYKHRLRKTQHRLGKIQHRLETGIQETGTTILYWLSPVVIKYHL